MGGHLSEGELGVLVPRRARLGACNGRQLAAGTCADQMFRMAAMQSCAGAAALARLRARPDREADATLRSLRSPTACTSTSLWTLAGGLSQAGYATHAVVSNPYLALQYGLGAGFDTYENVSLESEALVALRGTLGGHLAARFLGDRLVDSGGRVSDRGIHCLRRAAADWRRCERPFLLWLHYIDPHAPYGCGGDKSFRGDTLLSGIRHDGGLGDRFEAIARLRAGEIRLTAEEKTQLIALYDAGVASVDQQVGRVLDELAALQLDDDVLVAVVSDHGEEFWEYGGVEHGHTFYDELVRVPLLFAGPGIPRDQRVPSLVSLADLPPTIAQLVGAEAPQGLDGVPIPLLGDAPAGTRAVRCEALLFAEDKLAVRTEQLKYVRWSSGKEELYDLSSDPLEQRDIADIAATVDLTWARNLTTERARRATQAGDAPVDTAYLQAAMERLGYA